MPPAEAKRLVLRRVVKGLGSVEAAEFAQVLAAIPFFGGRTPAQLVRAGQLKVLLEHINAMSAAKT
jgi:hypothetical protein